jgi:hypothetical protein
MKATNEWKAVASIEQGHGLIAAAKVVAKATHEKKALGHGVTATRTPRDVVSPKTRTPRDTWTERPGHGVTMAENPANPSPATVSAGFSGQPEKASHRTPHVPPLYIATPVGEMGTTQDHGNDDKATTNDDGISQEAIDTLDKLWAVVGCRVIKGLPKHERIQIARAVQQQVTDRHRPKPATTAPAGAAHHRHHHADGLTRERDDFAHECPWND